MPESLGEGLYLALIGMGLVFIALVVFMLILLALQKLFPNEEVTNGDFTYGDQGKVLTALKNVDATKIDEPAREELGQTSLESNVPPNQSALGPRVAALAAALYITLENGPDSTKPSGTTVNPSAISRIYNGWSVLGRASLWSTQGHRPESYGQRTQSPYTPRGRLRE